MSNRSPLGSLIVCLFVLVMPAQAAITTSAYYRLGETENGTMGANGVAPHNASANANHMINTQSFGKYSSNVSFAAAQATGSTISYDDSASERYYSSTVPFAASNVGVELWVRAANSTATNTWLVGNGADLEGIGLRQNGAQWQAIHGSATPLVIGSAPIKTNQWVHLAVVRDGAETRYFVNGLQTGTSSATPTNPGGIHFGVNAGGGTSFRGFFDEARIFTFSPGQFNPADLLIHQNLTPTLDNSSFELGAAGQPHSWNPVGNVELRTTNGVTDGSQALAFNQDSAAANGLISQTFATTAGTEYELTFDFGKFGAGAGTAALDVELRNAFDGALLQSLNVTDATGTLDGNLVYQSNTISFVATQPWTTVLFQDASSGTTSFDAMLDNISLVEIPPPVVPEPSTLALLGMGLAGTMIASRRRRK